MRDVARIKQVTSKKTKTFRVSLAGRARDNGGSSIRTIHLAFTLASAPVVSLLPPYRFALPFNPDASF